MRKYVTFFLAFTLAGFAGSTDGSAQDMSALANKIIEEARQDCQSFEDGKLTLGENVYTQIDVTGDGKPDEAIDFSEISCSTAASLYCGTGGCSLEVIADGKSTRFLTKDWKVFVWDEQPILMLIVHGSECGGNNLRRCYRATVWTEQGFSTVGP